MPCLFALLGAFAPRLALLVLWLFTDLVGRVFGGNWFWPLLGLIFLPFTTLLYVLAVGPLGPTSPWGWLAVIMGLVLDLERWWMGYINREQARTMARI